MVTQIRKCSTALLRLLNNILDISKVESGKLVMEETEFELGRELEGLVDMFSVQCINQDVETILDLSDDMPKVVRGDSARVVQIFANLISNSIKFTKSGYIILKGWCEYVNTSGSTGNSAPCERESLGASKMKVKQHGRHEKISSIKDSKVKLWFEVNDTGSGIDPSKWESVFESFEQADPSTTRLHGGTGLGLCIVRNLVNKMGGEIKVVKKNGPGTLMQLYLLLGTPADGIGEHCRFSFREIKLGVLLALNGRMGRTITLEWLQKNGMYTQEASTWNELAGSLQELFEFQSLSQHSHGECSGSKETNSQCSSASIFIIFVDIGLLDLSTDIWKEQLNFLDKFCSKAEFAWILDHDTSNIVKMELRQRGHSLMVNKPLYKAKMIQILESVVKERDLKMQKNLNGSGAQPVGDSHEALEIDVIHSDATSSDDSAMLGNDNFNLESSSHSVEESLGRLSKSCPAQYKIPCDRQFEFTQMSSEENTSRTNNLENTSRPRRELTASFSPKEHDILTSNKAGNNQNSLEGLCILLAEDTPVLQRVATIMLEKMGAEVVVVGDGLQAVDALKVMSCCDKCRGVSLKEDNDTTTVQTEGSCCLPYDLVLMDCQMPKMDGYEATRAIRTAEMGTNRHIPIVALTAHAMSSDEAKCLKVGMDAYLTKPIDCKLMVSTILSLTKKTA